MNELDKAVIRPKIVVLFLEIGWVTKFLLLTRPHNQMCIRMCIFLLKTHTQKKTKQTKEEKQK